MKLKILGVMVGLCCLIRPAAADSVSSVFDSFSQGSAGVYQTSRGTHFYGGNVTARIHQPNTPDFVGFSAPSVKAGCGGIDFYAGSFSLISGDEVVQMARGIAQGAAPYFFNLAISSICAGCGAAMQDLSNRLNQLNQFAKSSCNDFYTKLDNATGWTDAAKKNSFIKPYEIQAQAGTGRNWVDSIMDAVSTRDPSSSVMSLMEGNTTYNILDSILATNGYTNYQFFQSERGLREILMSLIGTGVTYYGPKGSNGLSPLISNEYSSKIEPLRMILADEKNPNEVYSFDRLVCAQSEIDDPKCKKVTVQNENMVPLQAQYLKLLDGDDGIFARLQKKVPISTEQLGFMAQADFPYVNIALKIRNPQDRTRFSEYIAYRAAFLRVQSLYEIAAAILRKAEASDWGDESKDPNIAVAKASVAVRLKHVERHLKDIKEEHASKSDQKVKEIAILQASIDAEQKLWNK